jgi:hypothetical protein
MNKLTVRQQCNRILKWYHVATKQQVIEGIGWYSEAHSLAVQLSSEYHVSVLQAAQIISVLSPQKKWEQNKREAVALFNEHFNGIIPAFGYFASARTIDECHRIMSGEWMIAMSRLKTYSFADNIAYLDSTEVTIDRHALRVAYDDTSAAIDKVTKVQYLAARQAYRMVAASLGIKAYQLQAITWVTYKFTVNR